MSFITHIDANKLVSNNLPTTIAGMPGGLEAILLGQLADGGKKLAYIMSDGQKMASLKQMLEFVAPTIPVLELPAWDCLPYDRVSPGGDITARRLSAISTIISYQKSSGPLIVLTSVNAMLQKSIPFEELEMTSFAARAGSSVNMNHLISRLSTNGFERVSTVREVGEFAVRGGILDVFVPGEPLPQRLDFFGDTIESIRSFDPASQRTADRLETFSLNPMSEVTLNEQSISRFRKNYLAMFGAATRNDALYQAISEGRRYAGMEHWLPLFHEKLDNAFAFMNDFCFAYDNFVPEAAKERHDQIADHYDARLRALDIEKNNHQGTPYKPVKPESLYLNDTDFSKKLDELNAIRISPFNEPPKNMVRVVNIEANEVPLWAKAQEERLKDGEKTNVFDAVVNFIANKRAEGKKILLTAWSAGSLDRLLQVLREHGLERIKPINKLADLNKLDKGEAACAVYSVEHGVECGDLVVIGEQDILGDRLARRARKKKRGADFISEVSGLEEGDIVVHVEHGIGQFLSLKTIDAAGAPHACLELLYAGEAKLYLPVENIELLSRYGGQSATVQLDKLGGVAWQSRKAKLKKRLLDMAEGLIKIAAARHTKRAAILNVPSGLYDEFTARFPYDETEDQLSSIESVVDDLAAGKPMDRLVCGDVGFGKTEVALRAAFIAAMNGVQVAVVVPTTLLARQHYKTFRERLHSLPLKLGHASRLVGTKELALTKKNIETGGIDIVVGTHALLGDSVKFANLGLLIIDEEQHFGVKHKERLKELKSDIHVLTLSATPIPRTMQLAMTGVRELSLITTPPVDRLAVRTFISPFDSLTIRETLMREHFRGGQSFYVCPRVKDLADISAFLQSDVPELKVAIAHGKMAPGELEDIMNAFYDGSYDILLSTTIVESGLDVPAANTLIVHRADMFGLAQLYQLRGRVGRSKLRAFALFTLPVNKRLSKTADRRLKVLQSLDTLGAGFQLASHDLDIRGAGNLLGDEQSGHIKEVGFELYQSMLEDAIAELKGDEDAQDTGWSPQISLGTPVLIPDNYVPDIHLRLGLYRRLGDFSELGEIDEFGAELIDRFGPLPEEVQLLLKIVYIKSLCRKANVEKLDAGPKGLVIHLRGGEFPNPGGLVEYISAQGGAVKIRPDQSIFLMRNLPSADRKLNAAAVVMSQLSEIAAKAS